MICGISYKQIAEQYVNDVLSGNVLACKLVKQTCQNFLDELAKQDSDEFPYYFDEEEAHSVCEFFPLVLKHSKGEFAGLPFDLQPWQVFITWTLFGWKRCSDHYRRYRRAYLSYARKNGKSTQAAGYGLYCLTLDGEPGAEVYVSATKLDQAKCVFEEAERMRRASPDLARISKGRINNIHIPSTNSFFKPTASDRPLDGPNPSTVIFDELHAWSTQHRKFYDTMVTGGASRRQPIQITITTAGDDKSEIWLEEYDYAKRVTQGEIVDNTMFAYIAEIDDKDNPLDPECWIKANPNLDISVSKEYLETQARDAKNKPSFSPVFISKHCNKIISSKRSAFDMDAWDDCKGDLTEWKDADAICAGVDLGGRDDFASYALVARFPYEVITDDEGQEKQIYRFETRVRTYLAEDSKRDYRKQPFAQWVHDGWLTICKHPIAELQRDLIKDCRDYGISTVAHDPYNAQQLGEELSSEGLIAAKMHQTYSHFNEPVGGLLDAVKAGTFQHNGNPLLRWSATNAVIVKDRQLRVMFDKAASSEKIDPIVATTMAFCICNTAPPKLSGSLYL